MSSGGAPEDIAFIGRQPVLTSVPAESQDDMRRTTTALLATCITASGAALGESTLPGGLDTTELGPAQRFQLRMHPHGLVEIEARDIPLGELLKGLAATASVEARLAQLDLASCSVNAKRQETASLREAIERLLDGFSYTLHLAAASAPALTVLTPCPPAHMPYTPAAKGSAAEPRQLAKRATVEVPPAAALDEDEDSEEGAPRSLDEFEPLALMEPSSGEEEGQIAANTSEQAAQEDAYRGAVISRALKVLDSPHRHLKSEAIASLADVRSPEVTDILIDAASGKLDLTMEARTNAVSGLWQSATELGSPDSAVFGALQQLANDPNPAISSIAQNALNDLRQRALVSAAPDP